MSNISMPSGIIRGRATSCCSLGVRTSAAPGLFNAASDWADSCAITIRRQRERGGAASDEFIDHTIAARWACHRDGRTGDRPFLTLVHSLMSYGVKASGLFSDLALYVDRILKGAKPSDLPIQRPTRFELVINARTARIYGAAYGPQN